MPSPTSPTRATETAPLLRPTPPVSPSDAESCYRPGSPSRTAAEPTQKSTVALRTLLALGSSLILALVLTLVLLWTGTIKLSSPHLGPVGPRPRRKNVIMMVSDGFGPASETFGRTMYHYLGLGSNSSTSGSNGDWWGPVTPLDELLVGASRTRSSSSWVTDSAAGATAFSCARKSYNGAIGVTDDQLPCGTVFEAAKRHKYKTGLIVTSRITHATPASFNSHVLWRDYENDIAEQQIGSDPAVGFTADLQLGGGRRHFVPQGHPESVREDSRDLLAEARSRGITTLTSRADFDNLRSSSQLPALGVFTPDHMAYNIDRNPSAEPSLEEMTRRGLELLHNATLSDPESPGFFVMVEGSRIDMAAHSNDPGTHAGEILHYYKVIRAVKEFVDKYPGETVMVSTSDHETGGLALARQVSAKYPEYLWKPDVVARQRKSTVKLAEDILKAVPVNLPKRDRTATIVDMVNTWLGVGDLSPDELDALLDPLHTVVTLDLALATVISIRAQLGWSTHGHSGVDVNLYAYGPGTQVLHGNHENTDVGLFLQQHLGLQQTVNALTAQLRQQLKFKHPSPPPEHDGPGLLSHSHEHAHLHQGVRHGRRG
ncbi:alkaline-phosphatase-like protein [Catenaria anguillulae PL171]|uniref:Alkaline phosphatase n=1 Tax=Catenaria anguillulae PL171 TaxID=765915 RepID=A0A1Y2HUX8_9FUNG|nr:alkaline-phosphatase-like protein [Catenaria anguillulae PL171]